MDTSPRTPCVGFSGRCQRCERLDHHLSPGQRCPGEEAHDLNHEGEAIPCMATKRQDTTEDAHLVVRQARLWRAPSPSILASTTLSRMVSGVSWSSMSPSASDG